MKRLKLGFLIILFFVQILSCTSFLNSDDYFSLIILPDTQYYSVNYPEIFHQQMDWIVKNKDLLNIQYVIHMGDITDNNREDAWTVASTSYEVLENAGVPYSIIGGNNDIKNPDKNIYDGIRHTELLNKYFPVSRFDKPGSWWRGGFFEPGKIDNYYCLFSYKDYKYMIMNLEVVPRSVVLKWADSIISNNTSSKVIVVTHDYLDKNGQRLDDLKDFGLDGRDSLGKRLGNNGDAVFKKLIKKNPNIIIILCGHKEGVYQKEVNIKISKDSKVTRKVFEILTDFQNEKLKGSDEKSGKGLLRVLKINPARDDISLSTISALSGKIKGDEIHLFSGK